jgi:hypothetical protein
MMFSLATAIRTGRESRASYYQDWNKLECEPALMFVTFSSAALEVVPFSVGI